MGLAMAMMVAASAEPGVRVVDHGLRVAAFPRYLGNGPGLGWQDVYNQDEAGRYWMRREFQFAGTRLGWRVLQTFAGDESRPVGRLALRFAEGARRVTRTQPRWLGTWGRHDEQFPGLLDVTIDAKGLAGVPVRMASGRTGYVGHVHARWQHEAGAVQAVFLMLPDDDRLFVEVVATPSRPAKRIRVSLCCWPAGQCRVRTRSATSEPLGYGKPHRFPTGDATALLADPKHDPTGRRAEGVCGLTYFPKECVAATVTRTFPLFFELELRASEPGAPAYAHVVLWELLHRRGDAAWRYLSEREVDTLARFDGLPAIRAPRFAEARRAGVAKVRKQLERFDAEGLPDNAPARQWAAFHRAEAARHLAAENWRAAAGHLKRARAPF